MNQIISIVICGDVLPIRKNESIFMELLELLGHPY